jgi:hypothetical protein
LVEPTAITYLVDVGELDTVVDALKLRPDDIFGCCGESGGGNRATRAAKITLPTELTFKIPQHITWVTENPGGQFLTGSFQPIEGDWSEQAHRHLHLDTN